MKLKGLEKRAHEVIDAAAQSGKNVLAMSDGEWMAYRNVGFTTLAFIKQVIDTMRRVDYAERKTLRDEFAMAALIATGASDLRSQEGHDFSVWANNAYKLADAMLKAREVKP